VNVDAAIDLVNHRMGIGVVIRDCNGCLLLAKAISKNYVQEVDIAEASAVLIGIQTAIERGWENLRIETDSLSVVNLCLGKSESMNDIANIIADIKSYLQMKVDCTIAHLPRKGNMVAHSIAKWATSHYNCTTWSRNFPEWLQKVANVDVSSCPFGLFVIRMNFIFL
jgi:ribonuclease HI